MNIINFRREYFKKKLNSKDLTQDPLILFNTWLQDAYKSNIVDPTSMCLSTVGKDGQPYQRIVLLKNFDKYGLVFCTNLFSKKSKHILLNNKVSLLFFWSQLERQICFSGNAEKLSVEEGKKYFYTRPRDSQLSACVSPQSQVISNRNILTKEFLTLKNKVKSSVIPFPKFWGGFRVKFNAVEFWQGRTKRLHDRFLYKFKKGNWKVNRLAP